MTDPLYYLYAVARPRPGRSPQALPNTGILPDTPVRSLVQGDLVAFVSEVPAEVFGQAAIEQQLQDLNWARARVVAHQQVLAALLEDFTLLPLKFCTLLLGEVGVSALLTQQYEAMAAVLGRLVGANEWGVKIFGDRDALAAWVAEHAEELAPARARVAAARAGAAYFLRKKLDQAAADIAGRVLAGFADASHEQFAACARQAVTNPLQPPQAHGRRAEMLLNGAYLIDDEASERFGQTLVSLEATYCPRGLTYELTGPWPPYNFV